VHKPMVRDLVISAVTACLTTLAGCAKEPEPSASPQPGASQGAEATPEPANPPPTAAPAPTATPEPEQPAAPPPPIPAPDTALSDAQIVQITETVDSGEIEQAQLAKTKAKDPKVKQFAARMVTQHTEAKQKGATLAKKAGLTPAESDVAKDLKTQASADLDTLKNTKPADFDAVYMTSQVKAHDAALKLITNRLIPAANDATLKAHLETVRATVEHHFKDATDIQQGLLSSSGTKQ